MDILVLPILSFVPKGYKLACKPAKSTLLLSRRLLNYNLLYVLISTFYTVHLIRLPVNICNPECVQWLNENVEHIKENLIAKVS